MFDDNGPNPSTSGVDVSLAADVFVAETIIEIADEKCSAVGRWGFLNKNGLLEITSEKRYGAVVDKGWFKLKEIIGEQFLIPAELITEAVCDA